jgi:hypothetical protein
MCRGRESRSLVHQRATGPGSISARDIPIRNEYQSQGIPSSLRPYLPAAHSGEKARYGLSVRYGPNERENRRRGKPSCRRAFL